MQTEAQTKISGVVEKVNVYYYSDQSADTRIVLKGVKEEIWFSAVAPVAERDTVEAFGKLDSLLNFLKQTHSNSVVGEALDEIVRERARTSATSMAVLQKEVRQQEVFRANKITDKSTTYSIPYQAELHFTLKLALLTFFYPTLACAIALILIYCAKGFTLPQVGSAITASFVVVSFFSLIGDQGILKGLAAIFKVDWRDAGHKSALKDGKAINLFIAAVLTLVQALIMLKIITP